MLKIPTLETKRLILGPISMAHSQGMFDLWSNAKITEHSGIVKDYDDNVINTPVTNQEQSDLIIDFWLKALKEQWGFRWTILLKGEQNIFTGTVGFNSLSDHHEIAYHLLPSHWRKGIMTEAAHASINWAKQNEAEGIEAFIKPHNMPSVALAKRLGLEPIEEYSNGAQKYLLLLN